MRPDQDPSPTTVDFDARVVYDGAHPTVIVRGEIDLVTAAELAVALGAAMCAGPRITLDLREVTFIDSAGVTVLLRVHRRLGQVPEAVVLRDPSPTIRRTLELAGVGHLFAIRTTASPG